MSYFEKIIHKGQNGYITRNYQKNFIQITFDKKPSSKTRDEMKANHWRWYPQGGVWYNLDTGDNEDFARQLVGEEVSEYPDEMFELDKLFGTSYEELLASVDEEETYDYPPEDFLDDVFTSDSTPVIKNPGIDEAVIAYEDILVVSGVNRCIYRDHETKRADGTVHVDNGAFLTEVVVPVFHCEQCDVYYMFKSDYRELRQKGRPCCLIMPEKEYQKAKMTNKLWAPISVMRSYGYNVNAQDDLTDKERQRILDMLISLRILSPQRIISFLSWLIGQREGMPNMHNAVEKWKQDKAYVMSGMESIQGKIVINSIYFQKFGKRRIDGKLFDSL